MDFNQIKLSFITFSKKKIKKIKLLIKYKSLLSIRTKYFRNSLASGIKVFLNISSVAFIMQLIGINDPIIIAPFASTCVIMYTSPNSPSARTKAIIGSYITASIITSLFPYLSHIENWWAAGFILAIHTIVMQVFNITHAPSAAIPISMLITKDDFLFYYLVPFYCLGGAFMVLVYILLEYIYPQHDMFLKLNSNAGNTKKRKII